jgi:uncharacterized protein
MSTPSGNNKRRRILFRIAVVLLAGFVELNILAYNHASSMLNYAKRGQRTAKPESLTKAAKLKVLFSGITLTRPESDSQPSDLAPDCRRLTIRGSSGTSLGAWCVDRGRETPMVVLFHGYGREKTSLLPEAQAFLELGASVLLVDFRGSGESPGTNTTVGIREATEVADVVRHARQNLPHSRLVLYGHSMGAAAILRAVAVGKSKPDAIIIEAVFDTLLNTVRHRFQIMGVPSFPSADLLVFWAGVQTGMNAFAHKPVDYAQSVTCPALVLHGGDDPRARLEDGRRVFDALAGPKQFKQFPGVIHESCAARAPAEWKATVGAFLASLTKATRDRSSEGI